MRKGYFGGLMRMTGIVTGRDSIPVSSPAIDTASPQPIHVEETISVLSPPSQTRLTPQHQETPRYRETGAGSIPGEDTAVQGNIPEQTPGNHSAANLEPATPGLPPLEVRETVTVDNVPDKNTVKKNTEPPHVVEREQLQVTRQTGESPGPLIHKYTEVVEVSGKDRSTRGTTAYRRGNKQETFPQQGQNLTAGPAKNKKEAGIPTSHERQLEQQEIKPVITFEAVRQWVAEPAQPAPPSQPTQNTQAVNSPHTSPPGPGLLHENREFSLSIGTIAVTVEGPQSRVEMQPTPTVQTPAPGHRDRKGGTGATSSRLGRHYVRIRG